MSTDGTRAQLIVGVVSSLLEAGDSRDAIVGDPVSAWSALGALARELYLGSRRRFELSRLADLSQVYLRLFLPPAPWQLVNLMSEGVLSWKAAESTFADVLVTTSHSAVVFSDDARRRSTRLLADSVERVRILKLTAPSTSLLRTSRSAPPTLVTGSELWFGPAPMEEAVLVAAASGGVS